MRPSKIRLFFSYALLIVLSVISLYPAIWVIMSSFKVGDSLFSETIIPTALTLEHYVDLFKETDYALWYWNTLKISVITMIVGTTLVVMTAYALSRFRFKGRKFGLMTMLVITMFPSFMGMIAIYILLMQIGLLDTHFALILVYSTGAIVGGAWVAKGHFDSLPRGLEEAAMIDGATNWIIFTRIMLPLSKPILTFVALTSFIGPWMDFIFAKLVLRSSEKKTLAVGLYEMVSTTQSKVEFTTFAAGSVLVAIPITLLFIFLQRYLIAGLTSGATKG
ncbi:sugar ABC transporter permease [Ammoniphilus sp. 3BR4]|uniref:sugar ABC transporter permease n=1 Tax=Ammoniphilus sp. 3BR4 TaxID=3158265 RepID=UPI003465A225